MSDDLIRRSDAIEAIKGNSYALGDDYMEINGYGAIEDIRSLPSADRPQKIIAQITFDEEKLHEIVKEAAERFKEECEITDRPQGKWINGHSTSGFYYKRCNQCFAVIDDTFFGKSSFDVNFCPNCGAKMGYKDETNRPSRD